ncbi:related to alpha-galactosidase precursor [Rhynchosporium secalis]|uniref:Alpha-galactosidase n=1 Tax=Rhynchosporium secalis TaxID=38038 RepID=A0A1E1MGK5_RHYSE|nr:related to alpha-galactosidase precursor [Rhynchosporium secalis]
MASQLFRLLLVGCGVLPYVLSSAPILQPTPPMGFNNWAALMCGLNESVFVQTAHSMVKFGLLDAGYNRINLDDCWSTVTRAANGSMEWDTKKFPRGLPWLTKYLKDLGFIPGIYTDAGNLSCGGFPGAFGFEALDAQTFADWGFEYVKLDGCNMPTGTEEEYKAVYGRWHDVLENIRKAINNPMIFSESAPAYFAEATNLTNWYKVMDWVPKFGQLARHSRDSLVFNSTLYWPNITGWDSIIFNYGQQVRLARYQRPGYFNDPDFLNVDHFDFTLAEKKSHFALWASFSAPLIISAWIPNLNSEEIGYLGNADVIAVDQDPLALQATLVSQDGEWDVLTKDLANGDRLLTVLNRGNCTASLSVPSARLGLIHKPTFRVKDLWTGQSIHTSEQVIAHNVPSHGTAIFRLSAHPGGSLASVPTGMIFNTYSLTTLTASSDKLIWGNSTAADGQVWQAWRNGSIRKIARPSYCLTDLGSGSIGLLECSGRAEQKWDYTYSGNLISRTSRNCLTEADNKTALLAKCLDQVNSQVVALPGGVKIVGR